MAVVRKEVLKALREELARLLTLDDLDLLIDDIEMPSQLPDVEINGVIYVSECWAR